MEEFEKENSRFIEKLISKNNEIHLFSLSNIMHSGTLSSTLVFLFQNKPGLNEEDFVNEVLKFEENLLAEGKFKEKDEENFNRISNFRQGENGDIDNDNKIDIDNNYIDNDNVIYFILLYFVLLYFILFLFFSFLIKFF
jgi:hypothetical protein